MPSPYSLDLRERVVEKVHSGMPYRKAAEVFNIGEATVKRWFYKMKKLGHVRPEENYQKGHSHKLMDPQILRDLVAEIPDGTSIEYAQKIGDISSRTIRKKLKLLGFSRKKSLFSIPRDQKKRGASSKRK